MNDRLPRALERALSAAYAARDAAPPDAQLDINQRIYLLESAQQVRAEAAMSEDLR